MSGSRHKCDSPLFLFGGEGTPDTCSRHRCLPPKSNGSSMFFGRTPNRRRQEKHDTDKSVPWVPFYSTWLSYWRGSISNDWHHHCCLHHPDTIGYLSFFERIRDRKKQKTSNPKNTARVICFVDLCFFVLFFFLCFL